MSTSEERASNKAKTVQMNLARVSKHNSVRVRVFESQVLIFYLVWLLYDVALIQKRRKAYS